MNHHMTGTLVITTGRIRTVRASVDEFLADPSTKMMGLRFPERMIVQYEAGPEGNEAFSMWEDVEDEATAIHLITNYITYVDSVFAAGRTYAD